jgi:hypothetical protein
MLRRYYGKISKLPIDQFTGHDGELVVDDLTGRTYVMDGITLGGHELVGATPRYETTPPADSIPGALWYDPTSGRLFIYYNSQWVDAAPNSIYNLPHASASTLGGIKIGLGLSINNDGVLTANSHTPSELINGENIVELGNDGALTVSGKITTPSVSGSGVVGENLYIGAGAVSGSNATSGSTIIQGGHSDLGTGGSGPVQIQTGSDVGNPNFKYTWNFDGQGRLRLPGAYATGGTLMSPNGFSLLNTDTFQFPRLDTASIIVPPNGSNDPIQLINDGSDGIRITTPRGTVLFGNQPEIIITQSHHFHIMKQDPAEVDLFFGDDYNYLKLPKEGNVLIGADGSTWNFNNDGNLTLPASGFINFSNSHSILTGLATESYVTSQGYLTSSNLSTYATESFVTTRGYLTSIPIASDTEIGIVKVDNVSIVIDGSGTISSVGTTSVVPLSSTAPASPNNGELWYDTESGKIFVYLNDSWVDTVFPAVKDLSGIGSIGQTFSSRGSIQQLSVNNDAGKLITINTDVGVLRLPQITPAMLGATFEFYFAVDAGQIHIQSYYTGNRSTTDVFRGSIFVGVDNATTGKLHKATATTSTACDLFLGQHHAKLGSYVTAKAMSYDSIGTWMFQGMCIGDTGQTPNSSDHPFQDYN